MTAIPQNRRRATGRPPLDVDTARELARGKSKDRQFVTALARGLEILRAFVPNDGPLGNQEIAQRTRRNADRGCCERRSGHKRGQRVQAAQGRRRPQDDGR